MSDRRDQSTKHIPCPSCGYDLFGLPLDLVLARCPECGDLVELDSARRRLLARRTRQTRLLGLACAIVFVAFLASLVLWPGSRALPEWSVPLAIAVLWLGLTVLYQRRHGDADYAGRVLVMFHFALVCAVGGVILVVAGFLALRTVAGRYRTPALIALGGIAFWLGWEAYWRASGLAGDGEDLRIRRTMLNGSTPDRDEDQSPPPPRFHSSRQTTRPRRPSDT